MLKQSSRSEPCPVCGRDVDGDCRFGDGVILCHVGTRFGPPPHLKVGDVIQISGSGWVLARTGVGFAGSAHEFRPDRGVRLKPKRQRSRVQELAARRRLRKFHTGFRDAMRCPEFVLLSAEEADHYLPLIRQTAQEGQSLLPLAKAIASRSPRWKRHLKPLNKWCKALDYQLQNAVWFYGLPTADDIASLRWDDE